MKRVTQEEPCEKKEGKFTTIHFPLFSYSSILDTRRNHHSVICLLQLSHMWEKRITDIRGEKSTVTIIRVCEDITGVPDKGSLLSQPYTSIQNPAELTSHFFATTVWYQKCSIIAAIQRLAKDCCSLSIYLLAEYDVCFFDWCSFWMQANHLAEGKITQWPNVLSLIHN